MRIPVYRGMPPSEVPADEWLFPEDLAEILALTGDDEEPGSAPVEEPRATVRESEEDADEM